MFALVGYGVGIRRTVKGSDQGDGKARANRLPGCLNGDPLGAQGSLAGKWTNRQGH